MKGTGGRGRFNESRLTPHRIRGVSFRRQRSLTRGATSAKFFATERPIQLDEESLEAARPAPLKRQDIHRLMFDTTRVELHAMVIDCIENVGHWRQLSHAFDNYISMRGTHENEQLVVDEPASVTHDHFLAAEAHAIYGLWRHRLEMLEWISQSQFSLVKDKSFQLR